MIRYSTPKSACVLSITFWFVNWIGAICDFCSLTAGGCLEKNLKESNIHKCKTNQRDNDDDDNYIFIHHHYHYYDYFYYTICCIIIFIFNEREKMCFCVICDWRICQCLILRLWYHYHQLLSIVFRKLQTTHTHTHGSADAIPSCELLNERVNK